jgi:hypothetical protein
MIGTLYQDVFNVSCAIGTATAGLPAVTPALLAGVAGAVSTWWPKTLGAGGGIGNSASAKLTSIKLNRIDTAGHYADSTAMTHVYTTPVAGGGFASIPPQLSLVASLRGAAPRAAAGRGRMYFPPGTGTSSNLDPDTGQVSTGTASQYATGVAALITAITAQYVANGVTGVVGITSSVGTGAFQAADVVRVGRIIDTVRSRRNKDLEAPLEVDIT